MTIPSRFSLLTLSLCLAACSTPPPPPANIDAPAAWQGPADLARPAPDSRWW
ncbi:RND transporter, partial [Pseudomonas sp. GD03867]|nr:RND transporter [Pseudomonas sp. GD03867]